MENNIILFVFYCSLIMIAVIIAYSRKTPIEKLSNGFGKLAKATRNTATAFKELSKTLKNI